jgi:hypothetical protein
MHGPSNALGSVVQVPDFPFLADDVVWAEVPIIGWIVGVTSIMLILYARFGWLRTHAILSKRRKLLGGTLAIAVALAAVLHITSGQPVPGYL